MEFLTNISPKLIGIIAGLISSFALGYLAGALTNSRSKEDNTEDLELVTPPTIDIN